MSETQTIMCVNSGSSSLKFHVYEMGDSGSGTADEREGGEYRSLSEELLAQGAIEGIGLSEGRLWFRDAANNPLVQRQLRDVEHGDAIELALALLSDEDIPSIEAVGHRVVHGGSGHFAPEIVTASLLSDLHSHVAWAPLHMPAGLRAIEALRRQRPGLPQVACFDTAFHAGMPELARRLPLPRRFFAEGVQKYGFHGLSYEFLLGRLGERAKGRLVMAHLGNGASMAACVDGRPVDTTMGMTPLGGFMMGTRTGDLDPGVLLYLSREGGYDHGALERLLDEESGLKGVSGETEDMKTLLELRETGHKAATQAIDMYCYQARRTIGSLAAALGGLDLLVFTGGVGERAAPVRSLICAGLEHLGIRIDGDKNNIPTETISVDAAPCTVMVVPTNEDLMIARHTYRLVFSSS